jgi:hypothetical protein
MENRDRTSNEGGQGQGNKPGQGGGQHQGDIEKPDGRPTPSGVPNEGRSTEGQGGGQEKGGREGQGDYEYKGGRQGTGGIPNPDDQDDRESAGSFRGTAELEFGGENDEQGLRAGENRKQDPNRRTRQPNQNPK